MKYITNACPECGQETYLLAASRFCPNEDAHPGGLVIFHDGLLRGWGLASPRTMRSSPKKGGTKA